MDMRIVRLEKKKTEKDQYAQTVEKTSSTLKESDGVYAHLKSPDVFGHDGDVLGKMHALEAIDAFYIGPLFQTLDLKTTRVLVTGDHATPCILGAHSADPVPFLLSGAGIAPKNHSFDESAPGPVLNGWELIPHLLR